MIIIFVSRPVKNVWKILLERATNMNLSDNHKKGNLNDNSQPNGTLKA